MLYVSPHRWLVRDYSEELYNHPAIPQTRCASILPALMAATGEDAAAGRGGFWVLENNARRIVGAATLRPSETILQGSAPLVDFLVAQDYHGQAPDLLKMAIETARSQGARLVRALVAQCDVEKADLLRAAGFRSDASVTGQLTAGVERFDLRHYVLELA
jgi:GNAT superfamily N-acetyltransferase